MRRLALLVGLLWLIGAGLVSVASAVGGAFPTEITAYVRVHDRIASVYVMDINRRVSAQFTDSTSDERGAMLWSPDGRHLVYTSTRHDGQYRLHIMDADGRNQRMIAPPNMRPELTTMYPFLYWSPDSRFFYAVRPAQRNTIGEILQYDTLENTASLVRTADLNPGQSLNVALRFSYIRWQSFQDSTEYTMILYDDAGEVSIPFPVPIARVLQTEWSYDPSWGVVAVRLLDSSPALFRMDRRGHRVTFRYLGEGFHPAPRSIQRKRGHHR